MAREYNIFRNQTICVESKDNSQITKAHNYILYYMYNYINNNFNTSLNKLEFIIISMLVGISEAIRLILINIIHLNINWLNYNIYKLDIHSVRYYTTEIENNKFNEWLSGLIDGNGSFNLTKKGYASFEITMDKKDIKVLNIIKQKFGGSIKLKSNGNSYKYKLHNYKGLLNLINNINGLIRNPIKLLQLNKLCYKYNITLKLANPLTFNNGWLSGLIDSDGSIYLDDKSDQIIISINQKNKYLLDPLVDIYGGRVSISNPKNDIYTYSIYRKKEILNLVDHYFSKYPLYSVKSNRCILIKDLYNIKSYKKLSRDGQPTRGAIIPNQDISNNLINLNKWINIKNKWDLYK